MKSIPMRSCIGCGEKKEKKQLIRVIRTPEGEVRVDATGRGNGRGAYICPDPACLEKAFKRKALTRALSCEIPGELYEALAASVAACSERGEPQA